MEYLYSKGMITRIIEAYDDIWAGIPELATNKVVNPLWFRVWILLKVIAGEEPTYQECLEIFQWQSDITDIFSVVEYKADVDRALREIGRGNWNGKLDPVFRNYKYYGRLQRILIARMLGIEDYELEAWGFTNIPQGRGTAISRMMEYLNSKRVKISS